MVEWITHRLHNTMSKIQSPPGRSFSILYFMEKQESMIYIFMYDYSHLLIIQKRKIKTYISLIVIKCFVDHSSRNLKIEYK